MASSPLYTPAEIAQLRALATEPCWIDKVSGELARRSRHGLREKMTEIRKAAGIKVRRGPPVGYGGRPHGEGWQKAARVASSQLLEATLRVGKWS